MAALAVLAVLAAPSAGADDASDYLSRVQQRLPYMYNLYGPQSLLDEGYKICGYERSRTPAELAHYLSIEIDQIMWDMPMSRDSASALKAISEAWLC
jgi:hypothetical protein